MCGCVVFVVIAHSLSLSVCVWFVSKHNLLSFYSCVSARATHPAPCTRNAQADLCWLVVFVDVNTHKLSGAQINTVKHIDYPAS